MKKVVRLKPTIDCKGDGYPGEKMDVFGAVVFNRLPRPPKLDSHKDFYREPKEYSFEGSKKSAWIPPTNRRPLPQFATANVTPGRRRYHLIGEKESGIFILDNNGDKFFVGDEQSYSVERI